MASVKAEVAARRLLRGDVKLPVSLSEICRRYDIALGFAKLNKLNAFLLEAKYKRVIMVNIDHNIARQRFSIAHEIGHAYMQHGPISFDSDTIKNRPHWQEVQANSFAAELLMPKVLLSRYGQLSPAQIARLCNVSMEAAVIRAEQLGWLQRELNFFDISHDWR